MEPDGWRRIDDLFQAALDCTPEGREAFLATACDGDLALRHEVESLLAAYNENSFTSTPAFADAVRVLEQTQAVAGTLIGSYRILREIGRGGMGTVYSAVRADDAFHKLVAIKVIRRGLDSDDIVHRFRSERQILATLDHPNITRLLDGGTTDDGLLYFVMELIEGEPIDTYCDRCRLAIADRLKLFLDVCAAVRYAHQNLVVHRDIKPGNVLVTKDGVPRLLDFGIAKLLQSPSAIGSHTRTDTRPLTPASASPEQVRGEVITTASDVYSLGVLLYLLLTGRSPYRSPMTSAAEIERAICEEEPEKPSLAIARDTGRIGGGVPVDRLRRQLQGDLDTIVLMALRKEPQRRYASVEQLAEDVSRHLADRPVNARADTYGYRAAKFLRRNKALAAAAIVVFLTLTGGIAATLWQARVARHERDVARLEQAKAARINAFLQEMIGYSAATTPGSPKRAKGHDATVIDMLDDAAARVETELADQPEVRADMLSTIGVTYSVLANYDAARRYLREAYDLHLAVYGPDRLQTATVMYRLANLSYLTGDYAGAESWIRKAVPIYRTHANDPGFELFLLPAILSDAAFMMRARVHFDEAEALWREALSYGPRLDAKHASAAIAPKTYLAQLYIDRGDIEQAAFLASDAVDGLRALGNPFALAQALIDLGGIRRFQRRYTEAESLIDEGTKMYVYAAGEDHPNIAFGLTSRATALLYEGRYDLAEQDARRALAIAEKVAKGSHYYAGAAAVLGRILARTGHAQEGQALLREALGILEPKVPRQSNPMASMLGSLGEVLVVEKQFDAAEPLLTESYATLQSLHIAKSPVLAEARERLVGLYDAWGKPQEAARYRVDSGHEAR